jgi:hypothetical protein
MSRQEMLEERWDVFRSSSKRRDFDDHDRQPVEKILPKNAPSQLPEAAVRRRDDADVDGPVLHAANRPDLAALQDAQQLCLRTLGKIADLVEQERASLCEHEQAGMIGQRTGEGPAAVAEQLAFDEVLRKRRAVDGDQRPRATGAVRVDRPCEHLLAGAGLAEDQDRRRAIRGGLRPLDDGAHLW